MLEYFAYKGKEKTPAAEEMGLSRTTFNNDSEVGGVAIKKFHLVFKEVDLHWLLTGEGEMIAKNIELNQTEYIAECRKNIDVLHKAIEMLYDKFKTEK